MRRALLASCLAFLPLAAQADSFETLIHVCLEGSLTRNPAITGEQLAAELDACLSDPEALETAAIAASLPGCRQAGDAGQISACLVKTGIH